MILGPSCSGPADLSWAHSHAWSLGWDNWAELAPLTWCLILHEASPKGLMRAGSAPREGNHGLGTLIHLFFHRNMLPKQVNPDTGYREKITSFDGKTSKSHCKEHDYWEG